MIRIALITAAVLASIAAVSPAAAQAAAPVRSLTTTVEGSTVLIAERKVPCADKSCAAKPLKRYVGAAPLGW